LGENVERDYGRALGFVALAEQRLADQVTTPEENNRKLVRLAWKKIVKIKVIANRRLGSEHLGS
jgi:hypothetical protein